MFAVFARKLKGMASWAILEVMQLLEDVVYNLGRSHKSLRYEVLHEGRRWKKRSPVMAGGLTDHIWTIHDIPPLLWPQHLPILALIANGTFDSKMPKDRCALS